jgi:hypothetical protein
MILLSGFWSNDRPHGNNQLINNRDEMLSNLKLPSCPRYTPNSVNGPLLSPYCYDHIFQRSLMIKALIDDFYEASNSLDVAVVAL